MADHAVEAEHLILNAHAYASNADETNPAATLLLAEAQVHATLAVAEQLRLQNILQLGQFHISNDFPPFRHLILEPDGDHGVRPAEQFREGLGL